MSTLGNIKQKKIIEVTSQSSLKNITSLVQAVNKEIENPSQNPPKDQQTKSAKYYMKDSDGWYIM